MAFCTFGPLRGKSRLRRLTDRFDDAATRCGSLAELRDLIVEASGELGFDFVALLHHASLTRLGDSHIRIDNYPSDWSEELIATGLAWHDPVHLACRRTGGAFFWEELGSLVPLGREQRTILDRSRRFGLWDGLTVPVNVPGEPCGSCSFAIRRGRELRRRHLLCAEVIGVRAFEAARRIAGFHRRPAGPRLSRRELQCLRLVAAGKSDWEISAILGISHETARQYVKRARLAYDAVSRTQLVVLGLRDDLLSFEEAIDPRA